MAEPELQKVVEQIQAPLLVADSHGAALFESRAWASVRAALGARTQEPLRDLLRKAARSGAEQTWSGGGFTVLASPVGADHVLLQLKGEGAQVCREQASEPSPADSVYRDTYVNYGIQDCIATSDSMIRIFTKAKQVAAYPTTILLLGETGVGKEVVSSFIHHNSDRADKPFIKINCSAIPEPLMESELFGYERGAFTGAREKGKMGLFEMANHGTILLDEIGDMNLSLQTKLLRTLQENEVMRVGGTRPIRLDVRLISATSRNIDGMVADGRFLDALYYRLNVVELHIPPLRERKEDIIPLAEFYLDHFCEKYKLTKELTLDARKCFLRYKWPGNVRELRNTMENLTVSSVGNRIGIEDLSTRLTGLGGAAPRPHTGEKGLKPAVESLQREMIEEALRQKGSLRKAASVLEMDATTLGRLAKKLGIKL